MGVTSLASARIHREPEYEPVGAAGPSTPEMALHRLPGAEDEKYVSVVGRDELASFQRNGHNGDEFGDEDIDFTPQNGYVEPDNMEYEEVGQGREIKNPKKGEATAGLDGKDCRCRKCDQESTPAHSHGAEGGLLELSLPQVAPPASHCEVQGGEGGCQGCETGSHPGEEPHRTGQHQLGFRHPHSQGVCLQASRGW